MTPTGLGLSGNPFLDVPLSLISAVQMIGAYAGITGLMGVNFVLSKFLPGLLPPANWLDWFPGIPGLVHVGVL